MHVHFNFFFSLLLSLSSCDSSRFETEVRFFILSYSELEINELFRLTN